MCEIAYVPLGGPFDENYTFHDKSQIDAMNENTFFVAKEKMFFHYGSVIVVEKGMKALKRVVFFAAIMMMIASMRHSNDDDADAFY